MMTIATRPGRWPGALIWIVVPLLAGAAGGEEPVSPARQVFERRILPIFRSPRPSSCVRCHLAGVDLKDYIRPSQEETFASLRDSGMIDLDDPERSEILRLIDMGAEAGGTEGPGRIAEEARRAEYEAFSAWIAAACRDPELRDTPPLPDDEIAAPEAPDEVIRHARVDRVLDSFERTIWALRFRCASCHMRGGHGFARQSERHGEAVMAWMKASGPAETMRSILDRGLVDLDEPAESLLLLKPLNEVEHGGGIKMARNDTDYMAFLGWIEDYARLMRGGYATPDELPATDRRVGSEIWLRVVSLPGRWSGRTGMLSVHPARDGGGFEERPAAISSVLVRRNPRFGVFAQGYLMLETPEGESHPRLPAGRYQVRLSIDDEERRTTDFDEALRRSRFVGSAEVRSDWGAGFKNATSCEVRGLPGP